MKTTPRQQDQSRGSAAGDTLNFRTNRSCTVTRIRVFAMRGLTFSGDTLHTSSQLSLFDSNGSTEIGPQARFSPLIERATTVLCIRKRRIKLSGCSSARSAEASTAAIGPESGTAACSGSEVASSTRTAGCISTPCSPRQRTIFGGLLTLSRTTDGGSKSSDSTGSNVRARSATFRTTSRTTSSKTDS